MSTVTTSVERPAGVTIIAIVNGFAGALTLLFWALAYFRLFNETTVVEPIVRVSLAATLGFLIADIIWAVPLLLLSCWGLWHLRDWGWLLAQMVNVLWVYSMTVIWVRDGYMATISPGAMLFSPFALFAMWVIVYLWKKRGCFWNIVL